MLRDATMDLFRRQAERTQRGQPLAERMRPASLEAFAGQRHLLAPGKMLERAIASDQVPSLILWGPPGTGKTTLARIVARRTGARFVALSAVGAGVKELRESVSEAAEQRDHFGKRTILFVDEIHRFNKTQQDALLPHVEAGTVTLIGATTENPSFEVNAPLLSRCRVVRLESLDATELEAILRRALLEDRELARAGVEVEEELLALIARASDGDARRALTSLEVAISLAAGPGPLARETVEQALQRRTLLYDRAGEEHYNVISAFIKSMRGSDPDAAVYWMTRMLEAGEDPLFIVRRMVIFASEDVGNADPQALQLAIATMEAVRFVGLPEAALAMAQAVTYLASAPKSNTALTAYSRARKDVTERGPLPVPLRLRNAVTGLMRGQGYGGGYRYPHDFAGHYVPERYLPDELAGRRYYTPTGQGAEAAIAARLREWEKARGESAPEVDDHDGGDRPEHQVRHEREVP
jgi:putative ATPase